VLDLGTVFVSGSGGTATATSPPFIPQSTGTYCFLGVYSGDGNYAGGSDGSTARECFTVTIAVPSVYTSPTSATITLGQSDSDTVTVMGNSAGGDPTGTVTFYVCGPTAAPTACTSQSKKLKKAVKLSVGGDYSSTATSAVFTPTALGTWCFAGYYSGNADYAPGSDTSVDECFTVAPKPPPCSLMVTVSPNPLVETGNSEVHAVIEVQACADFAGDTVDILSSQLENTCGSLTFEDLQDGGTPVSPNIGNDSIMGILDDDGNLDVVVNGFDCAPGDSVVEADLLSAPYLTALTTLAAGPPVVTPPGLTGYPNPEVETGDTPTTGISDVYAVFYVETSPVYAEDTVEIDSSQLFSRCGGGVTWISNQGTFPGATATATLDDDGNAVFVFLGSSCAAGTSAVVAVDPPGSNISYTTSFIIEAPTPNL
jgi:hypothetical protein